MSVAALASPAAAQGTAPGAPTGVQAIALNGRARLHWTAPTTGGTPTGYEYQSRSGSTWPSTWTTAGSTTQLWQDVSSLTNGTAYEFRVRATNATGNSAASAVVTATPGTSILDNQSQSHVNLFGIFGDGTSYGGAPFTTGGSSSGYRLKAAVLALDRTPGTAGNGTLTRVDIYTSNSSGNPDTLLGQLVGPTTITDRRSQSVCQHEVLAGSERPHRNWRGLELRRQSQRDQQRRLGRRKPSLPRKQRRQYIESREQPRVSLHHLCHREPARAGGVGDRVR